MEPTQPLQSIDSLRIGHAVNCTLRGTPKGRNLACPREQVTGPVAAWPGSLIWREAAVKSKNRVSLGYWDGKRLRGMASARSRPGGKSWEIDCLYLSGKWESIKSWDYSYTELLSLGWYDDFLIEDAGLELLEQLNLALGYRSAERVFLRLPANSPALALARRSGFTPAFSETLLDGYGGPEVSRAAGNAPEGMRPKDSQDDYPLFQLYCASAPAAVRETWGLTFDQWRESREDRAGWFKANGRREWVADIHQGRLAGWLSISRQWVMLDVQLMTHPDHQEPMYRAIEFALAQPGIQRWLTPDYQENVADRLRYRGFRQVAEYTMLVKPVAVPVSLYGTAPVEA